MVRWIILGRFLGLRGGLHPLIAMKSSSFSLFVKAITNSGSHTPPSPPPDDDPSFSLSDSLPRLLWWLPWLHAALFSGELIDLPPPLVFPLIASGISEFLNPIFKNIYKYKTNLIKKTKRVKLRNWPWGIELDRTFKWVMQLLGLGSFWRRELSFPMATLPGPLSHWISNFLGYASIGW